jgi:hypothetical protein
MLILLFVLEGIILLHWLPWKQTVNGVYYACAFKIHLGKAIQEKETGVLDKTVVPASKQFIVLHCI